MNTQAISGHGGKLLEIRTLHVFSGNGQATDFRSVHCPVRKGSATLEQCLACPESDGVAQGPSARPQFVSCRGAGPAEPRTVSVSGVAGDRAAAERTPVSAVMTTEIWAVRPDVSLEALTDLFLVRGLDGVPVVDGEGRPTGIVSQTDLVRERFVTGDTGEAMGPGWHASRGHYRVEVGPGVHPEALARATVADAMTCAAFTVSENAPVAQAVMLMASRSVHRVPVVSDDGRVAGMITSIDVLRWLARQGGHPVPSA